MTDVCANSSRQGLSQRRYRAVCFDLDGTLLPMDLDAFLSEYYTQLGRFMVSRGLDAATFKKSLNSGVKAMVAHESTETNCDVFWGRFFEAVRENCAVARSSFISTSVPMEEISQDEMRALFEEFYDRRFGAIGRDVVPDRNMVRAVATLREKGYPIVLATMPLFPPRALEHRCEWSGLSLGDFVRATNYENSTAAKPSLRYYAENLAALGVGGSDVLMVGNNTVEDLAFAQLGADTYLVTDHLLNPIDLDLSATRHGTTADFCAWVSELPDCEDPVAKVETGAIDPALTMRYLEETLVATPEELARAKENEARSRAANDRTGDAVSARAESAQGVVPGDVPAGYVPVGMEEALGTSLSEGA